MNRPSVFRKFLAEEPVLIALFLLFIVLTAVMPARIHLYHSYIDWKTMATLACLILAATGIKESGALEKTASAIIKRVKD